MLTDENLYLLARTHGVVMTKSNANLARACYQQGREDMKALAADYVESAPIDNALTLRDLIKELK